MQVLHSLSYLSVPKLISFHLNMLYCSLLHEKCISVQFEWFPNSSENEGCFLKVCSPQRQRSICKKALVSLQAPFFHSIIHLPISLVLKQVVFDQYKHVPGSWGLLPILCMVDYICFWDWTKHGKAIGLPSVFSCPIKHFWCHIGSAQVLHLALHSGITFGGAQGTIWYVRIKSRSATCKASTLPSVLAVQHPPQKTFKLPLHH